MKQISGKEYEQYRQYRTDRLYGRRRTPYSLRLIRAGFDFDPEQTGKHMPGMLDRFRNEGIVE